ncbi:hypothetical protein IWQ60_001988 [Tieghemiomyces parasiticus]|uniref:LIM-domain binding protein-domain-containing protein n=1 Tax=Tieghemiomyces parasiticus TaxID=78921 RepID=A0A9W8E217_9FUNG|nr:hypothetical protein IWQ60_001988 [Tieghemiomyces parasiticus]
MSSSAQFTPVTMNNAQFQAQAQAQAQMLRQNPQFANVHGLQQPGMPGHPQAAMLPPGMQANPMFANPQGMSLHNFMSMAGASGQQPQPVQQQPGQPPAQPPSQQPQPQQQQQQQTTQAQAVPGAPGHGQTNPLTAHQQQHLMYMLQQHPQANLQVQHPAYAAMHQQAALAMGHAPGARPPAQVQGANPALGQNNLALHSMAHQQNPAIMAFMAQYQQQQQHQQQQQQQQHQQQQHHPTQQPQHHLHPQHQQHMFNLMQSQGPTSAAALVSLNTMQNGGMSHLGVPGPGHTVQAAKSVTTAMNLSKSGSVSSQQGGTPVASRQTPGLSAGPTPPTQPRPQPPPSVQPPTVPRPHPSAGSAGSQGPTVATASSAPMAAAGLPFPPTAVGLASLGSVAPANAATATPTTSTAAIAGGSPTDTGFVRLHHFFARFNRLADPDADAEWQDLVRTHFADNAIVQITVAYDENELTRKRTFDLNTHTLPGYFQALRRSGISRQMFAFESHTEHDLGIKGRTLECPGVTILDMHKSGTKVQHEGRLSVYFNAEMKIDVWEFTTDAHIELLPRVILDTLRNSSHHTAGKKGPGKGEGKLGLSLSLVPESPINGSGYPESVIRALEMLEVVSQMGGVMQFAALTNAAPQHAFQTMATNPAQALHMLQLHAQAGLNGTVTPAASVPATPGATAGLFADGGPLNATVTPGPEGDLPSPAAGQLGGVEGIKKASPKTTKRRQAGSKAGKTPLASPALSSSVLVSPISMTNGGLGISPNLPGGPMTNGHGLPHNSSMPPPDMTGKFLANAAGGLLSPNLSQMASGLSGNPASPSPVLGKKKAGNDAGTKTKRARTTNPSPRGRKPKNGGTAATAGSTPHSAVGSPVNLNTGKPPPAPPTPGASVMGLNPSNGPTTPGSIILPGGPNDRL